MEMIKHHSSREQTSENHGKSWLEFFSSYYLLKSYFGTCLS